MSDSIESVTLNILRRHIGQENRIDRRQLVSEVGHAIGRNVHDREVRAAIEFLRRNSDIGALICSSSGTGGYWIAQDHYELLRSYQEERRRGLSTLVTIRQRMRTGEKVLAGQMRMF